jgi:hypothetical protein
VGFCFELGSAKQTSCLQGILEPSTVQDHADGHGERRGNNASRDFITTNCTKETFSLPLLETKVHKRGAHYCQTLTVPPSIADP